MSENVSVWVLTESEGVASSSEELFPVLSLLQLNKKNTEVITLK